MTEIKNKDVENYISLKYSTKRPFSLSLTCVYMMLSSTFTASKVEDLVAERVVYTVFVSALAYSNLTICLFLLTQFLHCPNVTRSCDA